MFPTHRDNQSQNSTLEHQIEAQALANVKKISMIDLIGGSSGILVIWYILQIIMPSEYIHIWAWAAFISLLMRIATYWLLNHHPSLFSIQQWNFILNFMSFLGGTVWGSIILLIPNEMAYSLAISGIIFAIIGAALGATGSNFSIFASFASPVSFLLVTHLLLSGGHLFQGLALFTLAYLIMTLSISFKLTRVTKQESLLQLKNKTLMQQFEQKRAEAEKANADKSRFLASASHDLRQPLQAMNLFAEALKQEIKDNQQQAILGKLHISIDAMGNLLNALLDVSKLDAGLVHVNKKNFHLFPILHKLESEFQPQANNKSVVLSVDTTIEKSQDDTNNIMASNIVIQSDPILFENILSNLLSNAIKYTSTGEISVSCKHAKNSFIIYVKDTGIGIAQDEQNKVFDAFYQIGNVERDRSKGIGLGLSIVKRLCQLLGHDMVMHSQVGEGTCFEIHLPAATASDITHTPTSPQKDLKAKVLVIDDDNNILDGMKTMLNTWGCEVLVAQSQNEAINALKDSQAIDLMLVDYRLQKQHTGADAIWAVRKTLNQPDLPAIIISGDTEPKRMQAMEREGFEVLHKPIKPSQLRSLMHHLLYNKQVKL